MSVDEEIGGARRTRTRRSTFGDGAAGTEDSFAALLAQGEGDAPTEEMPTARRSRKERAPKPPRPQPQATPKRPKRARRPSNRLDVGGVPRVDLLPPELRNARAWRVARRRALLVVLAAALIVVAGIGAALWHSGAQVLARTAAAVRTVELTEQQNQFGDVSTLLAQITRAEEALVTAGGDEVDWTRLLDDVRATLPPDSRVTTIAVDSSTPLVEIAQPADPLRGSRIGMLTITAFTPSVPDTAAWVRALNEVPGFENATPRAAIAEGGDETGAGASGYTIDIGVDLTDQRLVTPPAPEAETEEVAP